MALILGKIMARIRADYFQGAAMFSVKGDSTIASVSELKQSYKKLLERVGRGESIVLQRNNEPVGVLLSYPAYQEIMGRLELVENLVLEIRALRGEEEVMSGKADFVPLDDLLDEYGIDGADANHG